MWFFPVFSGFLGFFPGFNGQMLMRGKKGPAVTYGVLSDKSYALVFIRETPFKIDPEKTGKNRKKPQKTGKNRILNLANLNKECICSKNVKKDTRSPILTCENFKIF